MKPMIKEGIGRAVVNIGNSWPSSKRFLKSIGMRTPEGFVANHRSVNVQTPDGKILKLTNINSNYLSFQLFWKGTIYYEPITTFVVQELLQTGATFVDVGANIGFYSLITSLTKPGIKVIAFEPNPKNFDILMDNIRANGFENIHCERLAISDSVGTATLYLNGSDMSASLLPDFQKDTNPALQSIKIQTATLDDYFEKQPSGSPLVLKIDVEGHEVALLRGGRRILSACAPDVIMEVLNPYPPEVELLFKELGYQLYKITDEGLSRSEKLVPVRRGNLFFLNYLISKRTGAEISQISQKIITKVKHIDLRKTSKYCAPQIPAEVEDEGLRSGEALPA
jgi:FkbM family methyltransferase